MLVGDDRELVVALCFWHQIHYDRKIRRIGWLFCPSHFAIYPFPLAPEWSWGYQVPGTERSRSEWPARHQGRGSLDRWAVQGWSRPVCSRKQITAWALRNHAQAKATAINLLRGTIISDWASLLRTWHKLVCSGWDKRFKELEKLSNEPSWVDFDPGTTSWVWERGGWSWSKRASCYSSVSTPGWENFGWRRWRGAH